jgi:hypothetical protein
MNKRIKQNYGENKFKHVYGNLLNWSWIQKRQKRRTLILVHFMY